MLRNATPKWEADYGAKYFHHCCSFCRAKVAAEQLGCADDAGIDNESAERWAEKLLLGKCPKCGALLAGHSRQIRFAADDEDDDVWSDVDRIYPKPSKTFSSFAIPKIVTNSLTQADKSLQADVPEGACVLFGRALEAVCYDKLLTEEEKRALREGTSKKQIPLANGLKQLREKNIIEDRLLGWSQQLRAFRNVAAHAPLHAEPISREDAEDLQAFVYAIIEYIYDLTERYQEFTERQARKKGSKP